MKDLRKITLFLGLIPLLLTSCEDLKKKAYCLETFNTPDYVDGMCYQASTEDVLESIHLINLPINPESSKNEWKYDLEWKNNISIKSFTFTDGLVGKKIQSVLTLSPNVVRLIVKGRVEDPEATFGYIKVDSYAFKARTERVKDAYIYAYVAIGQTPDVVVKPETFPGQE